MYEGGSVAGVEGIIDGTDPEMGTDTVGGKPLEPGLQADTRQPGTVGTNEERHSYS